MQFINNTSLFLTVLESGMSKTKVPADVMSGEDSVLSRWCPLAGFLPGGREQPKNVRLLFKGTAPINQGSALMIQ